MERMLGVGVCLNLFKKLSESQSGGRWSVKGVRWLSMV